MQKTLQEKQTVLAANIDYANELLLKWEREGRAQKTTLFIGDSFFDARYFWTDFYDNAFSGLDAIAAGISGTTTYDWEYFAQAFLSRTSPKNLVVNLGTNNFYDDHDGEDEAILNLQHLFCEFQKILPHTEIYYCSIAQRTDTAYKTQVDRANVAMREWCRANGVNFVYVTELLTPETLRDGVHPKIQSYAYYTEALRSAGIEYEKK